jgi:DNA-binding transcriptional MocR family regulator
MQTETKPRSCHWSRHLGGSEYIVYDILGKLLNSRGMSEITISSRHLAAMTVYRKDTIAAALRELEATGWIERYIQKDTGGRYKPDTFIVNSHDEWVVWHPGQCPPVSKTDTGEQIGLNPRKSILIAPVSKTTMGPVSKTDTAPVSKTDTS